MIRDSVTTLVIPCSHSWTTPCLPQRSQRWLAPNCSPSSKRYKSQSESKKKRGGARCSRRSKSESREIESRKRSLKPRNKRGRKKRSKGIAKGKRSKSKRGCKPKKRSRGRERISKSKSR